VCLQGVGAFGDDELLLEDPPETPTADMMRRAMGGSVHSGVHSGGSVPMTS